MPGKTPTAAGLKPPDGSASVPEVLGANVRAYRLLQRLEQWDLAVRMQNLGYTWLRNTVSEVERARRNLTVEELLALTLVLNVTVDHLLDPRGPTGQSGPAMVLFALRDMEVPPEEGPPQVEGVWLHVRPETMICRHHPQSVTEWSEDHNWVRTHFGDDPA